MSASKLSRSELAKVLDLAVFLVETADRIEPIQAMRSHLAEHFSVAPGAIVLSPGVTADEMGCSESSCRYDGVWPCIDRHPLVAHYARTRDDRILAPSGIARSGLTWSANWDELIREAIGCETYLSMPLPAPAGQSYVYFLGTSPVPAGCVPVAGWLPRSPAAWDGEAWLRADPDFVDVHRFRRLVAAAATVEDRVEADLAAGLHTPLLSELMILVAEHPLRERMTRHLMLALYRCGDTSAALNVYRRTRADLIAELGVDPGPELVALHQAVLRRDPALTTSRRPVGSQKPKPWIAPEFGEFSLSPR